MQLNDEYVQTKHREYLDRHEQWELVSSVISGDVKKYLRNVGKIETGDSAQKSRQQEYEDGAIFYNFTKRTLDGMVGAIFRKDPEIELPTSLEYLLSDADGNNQGIVQQSQDVVSGVLKHSRVGLFVDAPSIAPSEESEGQEIIVITQKHLKDGLINPKIQVYPAHAIINWRTERYGSVNRICMVVLQEEFEYIDDDNEFEFQIGQQYRVLDFDETGYYRQRVFKYAETGGFVGVDTYEPVSNGKRMEYIPFVFVGADNNDQTTDDPVLYPLAKLNVGHFRNSTDNEEFLHLVAQAMLTVSPSAAIANKWQEANPNGIRFGSRNALNLGEGGSADLLQAQPNNANSEAMATKENQAIQIGAQLITPSSQDTAEAARIKHGADSSVSASISNNVSDAYMRAIGWCAEMLNVSGDYKFQLSKDFFFERLTAQERAQWVMEIQNGITPKAFYYARLRQTGEIDPKVMDDEIDEMVMNDGGNSLGLSA